MMVREKRMRFSKLPPHLSERRLLNGSQNWSMMAL